MAQKNDKTKQAVVKEKKFVKVAVVNNAGSLMQCGGGSLCNESKR